MSNSRAYSRVSAALIMVLAGAGPALADDTGLEPDTIEAPEATKTAPEATQASDDAGGTAGWFRLDTDSLGTQLWVGATHQIGSLALASDIYVVGSSAELDVGPALSFGQLALTPMLGISFDFAAGNFVSVVPQLFTIYANEKLHVESWIQVFVSPFTDGVEDVFYTRNFVLYKLFPQLHVGPQIEYTYRMNEVEIAGVTQEAGTKSLPIGGQVSVGYGKNNTLAIFLGYETQAAEGSQAIAGRFTFVRTW